MTFQSKYINENVKKITKKTLKKRFLYAQPMLVFFKTSEFFGACGGLTGGGALPPQIPRLAMVL